MGLLEAAAGDAGLFDDAASSDGHADDVAIGKRAQVFQYALDSFVARRMGQSVAHGDVQVARVGLVFVGDGFHGVLFSWWLG